MEQLTGKGTIVLFANRSGKTSFFNGLILYQLGRSLQFLASILERPGEILQICELSRLMEKKFQNSTVQ